MYWEELKALADKAFEFITSATKTPQDAMAVLGMAFANEEDEEVRTTSQKLVRLLAASPAVFNNRWVQKKISDLLRKKIENFKKGRVPVEDGKYVYITGDPVVLIGGSPLLKAGEGFYIGQNGVETGERVLLRSPNNHKSEVAIVTLVDSPELREAYGHVKNVLILNVLDDTLLRLGGADVDGDKVFMSAHPILIGASKRLQNEPLVHGDYGAPEAKKMEFGDGAVLEYDLRTIAPSPVGIVTYYTVAYADLAQCEGYDENLRMRYWNRAALGRIIQGRVIDDAKKGTVTEIPDVLVHNNIPHWLADAEPGVRENVTVYKSTSPMGRLYDYVEEVLLPRLNKPRGEKSIALLDKINYNPVITAKLAEITGHLSSAYRRDVARLIQEKEVLEEVYNERFKTLVAKHQRDLAFHVKDYDASDVVASIILADATYEARNDKPSSYLYVVAIDYLVMALRKRGDAFRLAPVLNETKVVEDGTPVRVHKGIIFFNDEDGDIDSIGRAPKWVADGQYTVVFANDRNYILVPRTFEEQEAMAQVEPIASLEIKGFKANGFESAEELAEAMKGHQVLLRKKKSAKTGDDIIALYTLNGDEVGVLAGQYSALFAPFVGEKGVVADVRDAVALRGVVSATLFFFHFEERTVEEETPVLSEEAQEAVESVTSIIDLAQFDEDDAFDLSVIL